MGAERVALRRNIFLNWEGSYAQNFVLIGEDGADYVEASEIVVENNITIGNSPDDIRAPFGIKRGRDILFRNNTVAGNMSGEAFALRIDVENPRYATRTSSSTTTYGPIPRAP